MTSMKQQTRKKNIINNLLDKVPEMLNELEALKVSQDWQQQYFG